NNSPPANNGNTQVPSGQQPASTQTGQGTPQTGGQTAATEGTQTGGVTAAVEANLAQPEKICAVCTPLIAGDPAAAAELIAAAKKYPELAEQLAECLSKIQAGLGTDGKKTIAALVAGAPPAFQASYAVALSPGDGGGGGGGGGSATAGGGG